ncbi:hypothetical protein ABBQ32_000319 [Trebouxia sp. C0010 RCD-2024]
MPLAAATIAVAALWNGSAPAVHMHIYSTITHPLYSLHIIRLLYHNMAVLFKLAVTTHCVSDTASTVLSASHTMSELSALRCCPKRMPAFSQMNQENCQHDMRRTGHLM